MVLGPGKSFVFHAKPLVWITIDTGLIWTLPIFFSVFWNFDRLTSGVF